MFLITGLQARALFAGIHGYSISELIFSAAIVSAVVIVSRFVWMYPATYLPRWLVPRHREGGSFAALAMAVRAGLHRHTRHRLAGGRARHSIAMRNGTPFPYRDLILFLTFSVILVTLVGQGLLLPAVMRRLGLARAGAQELQANRSEEFVARRLAVEAAMARLEDLAAEQQLSEDVVEPLRVLNRDRLNQIDQRSGRDEGRRRLTELHDDIELRLNAVERAFVNDLYRNGKLKDEARRRIEYELDLRDADISNQQADE